MFLKVLLACMAGGFVALVFYAPFWLGHSTRDIVQSFSSPPSARLSEYSFLRVIYQWIKVHGLPAHTSWTYTPLYVLSQRNVWDRINYVTLGFLLIMATIWIWRIPTTRTMILAALATLGALLIITPWFFAWYVTWLVGLAIICLHTSKPIQAGNEAAASASGQPACKENDLFTSSLPYALEHVREQHLVEPGDIGLIINAGSGIQVGCAIYYF